ncbi:MAG: carboxypeptidase-like regulatory domain-containing protein [Pseudomonadota bacterium]
MSFELEFRYRSIAWSTAPRRVLFPALAVVLSLAACAKVSTPGATTPGTDGGVGADRPPGGGADTQVAMDMRPIFNDTAPPMEAGGGCNSGVTCSPPNGRYCGVIGNGCSSTLDCGACPGTQVCEDHQCVSGPDCTPLACQVATGKYCGMVGDGCGRAMACGGCDATQACSASGLCVASAGCVPLTCNQGASRFCGVVGDGCGGMLNCGACTAPATCGGLGVPGVCGDPNCKKITCTVAGGGQYCGKIGDGCGGTLDCSAPCPMGLACGAPAAGSAAGVPNVCPGTGNAGACTGIACNVPKCTGTATTSISGTVYDPAGKLPLYNATVYVPNAPLEALPEGVSCDKCSAKLSGSPIATALSDATGKFTLTGVPAGSNIPLVIQVGKWRRQVMVPTVAPCVNTAITDANMTRLPRMKSEGNMPKIALTTGGSDAVECFLRKVGIADSEFTTDTGTGRVNLFVGGEPAAAGDGKGAASFSPALGGATFPTATTLWGSPTKLLTYDILIMSCEGSQYPNVKLPYINNVKRYADSGGRIFNGHLHFYWLRNGPAPWPMTADYIGVDPVDPPSPSNGEVDTTFPKGMALADWLVNVGGSATRGQIQLYGARHSVNAVRAPTQKWISIGTSTEYLTFNTPVESPADAQCGRVVETDIHVKDVPSNQNGKDDSDPKNAFPTGCMSTTMSAQEKALEFLFFDLSSCVQPDTTVPVPPPVPPPGLPATPPAITPVPPPVPPPPPPPPPPPIP